ncbi:MAG: MATE family efflux transporter [Treponemataceae bacterium]|nr:MATE family efflux transporter [Treponemataceae bacterium]
MSHLFSKKDIWSLVWPLMIEQLLAITLGIADIIMVATLGESAVSGVSLVDSIFVFINQLFAALATGGSVVCSQYIGKGSPELASKTAKQLIGTVFVSAVLVAVIGFFSNKGLLSFLFGDIEASVMDNASTYFSWMLLGLPSVALYNACAALFRAQRNSRISMFTGFIINVLNIGGNAVMLYGLHFGVEGVAIPTFIARTTAAIILLLLLYQPRQFKKLHIDQVFSIKGIIRTKPDFYLIKKILQIGVPNGLENSMFQLGKILVVTLVATFGTGAIAANAASNTISAFEVLPASSIGLAMLTVIGQCMGAKRPDEAVYYTKRMMAAAYLSMAALNVPLLLSARWLIGIYGMSPETTELGWRMLMCHGLCGIVFWPASFTLPNALRAANDARYTMVVSLISMWTVRVGLSYVYANTFGMGAFGVWVAMATDWVFRGAFFIIRFKSGKWKNRQLV